MIIEVPFNLGQKIYQIEENDLVKHKIEEIRISKRYWKIVTNKRHVVINESLDKIYFFKKKDAVEYLKKRR